MAELEDAQEAYKQAMALQKAFGKAFLSGFRKMFDEVLKANKYRGLWIGDMTQSVEEQIEAFLEKFPEEEYGCGHIVLSDKNLGDGAIQFCINRGKQFLAGEPKIVADFDYSPEGTAATIAFLEALLAIPEEERGEWFDE